MLVHWIWLATRAHINERVKVELVRHFQDPEAVYFADAASYLQIEGLSEDGKAALADKSLTEAEKILCQCQRENLGILTYQDAAYPARLKNISDPPLVFYYKGRLPDFDGSPLIGVVGTRKASAYGMNAAKKLGYQVARCGGIVVSGMAYGIDGQATRGALTAGAPAVGILGCGADVVYPPSNRGLFEDMEQYGCLLSEFVPGTPPMGFNFPKRNRIISGLSCGVLVVEAPEKSGALITAQAALDQGRDVFVVPGNIDVDTFVGSNRLLREGAMAVSSGWDILNEYEAQFPDKIRKFDAPMLQKADGTNGEISAQTEKIQPKVAQKAIPFGKKKISKQKEDKKVIDNGAPSPYSDLEDKMPPLLPDEQKIVSALTREPRPVDDVIAQTGLPTAKMLATLTLLQVKGIVRQHPGKRISLK
ncbi:MAG: DNA-processing protein DprA [Oscillospiraceae bacterium]|nr:DNA-processing protein DprA [Oscillospiraceae bacterium]